LGVASSGGFFVERNVNFSELLARSARVSVLGAAICGVLAGAATPAAAVTRTTKTFGKWTVTCNDNDQGARNCALTQSLSSAAAANAPQRMVFALTVAGTKDKPRLIGVVPIGVSLPDGLTLNFGDGQPLALAYNVCAPRVCIANAALDAKVLAALKGSTKVLANYVLANKKLIQVNVDTASFGDAYAYLASQQK